MTSILGISAFYHDSASALIIDGEIVAAAQEERFSRRKHDPGFPAAAIDYCLRAGNVALLDLDYVSFYEKPLRKFERLLETYLAFAPAGFSSFLASMPSWLGEKLFMRRELHNRLRNEYTKQPVFTEHHEAHAASAFFPSPFEEAAILTLDGVGEWATTTYGTGRGNRLRLTHEIRFPHSLGLLYSAFTYFCGFKVNSGEYKLMGLAPYGQPKYVDLITRELIHLMPDGSFRLNLRYFNYCQGLTMTSKRFERLFGGPPRRPDAPLTDREIDLAASIQVVTEEAMLRIARHVHAETGLRNLCLAGGVALNCVGNGRLLREGPFESIWIQPAAGDAGGALGAALFVWYQLLGNPRISSPADCQNGSLLGPRFATSVIEGWLRAQGANYRLFERDGDLCQHVAEQLAAGKVVGWFQGRMEFGPRALGSRSILADPRPPEMQSQLNRKIKFRESFRPFAPIVPHDRARDYFAFKDGQESPYMLLTAPVRESQRLKEPVPGVYGLARMNAVRSLIPAVTHVDYSARVQTVDEQRNPLLLQLLRAFDAVTNCPVLVNTSFNVRGEPIVCSPAEAYRCFMATNMDVLVLENCVLAKSLQPSENQVNVDHYFRDLPPD